ncbi:MAG: UDP-N-acetylglucosamine diphosphorylase/glucosamine-1-phosphate N-acetyltransferase [Deltaproteobacteria bacterium RIFCSPLOWO2_12_FULL_43_16]|nr:MAG: UDP-N-acetylglucosamine diphosphorylase/glucosamine-1-phosphate N-acetyltransferase [Deltaproteobacteria bacterium GWA2_43_19]OGQ58268.1 MAG: UDP-N-acetylglucosamine diphosphorylase/glucosamine-1-phosphate N-acetyltransferase [Deltaproteobacteria bacterium RIFCSPLOWO2_12_FULL_43_16]HBR16845.1 bifunctional UDP-N-acetylglucosamine diphosphorylase/glucosamine-1-phosphate N-acetyltransferase GlmU [Deltaproteobacteria bacterium]
MKSKDIAVIILAAGLGKRMKSDIPKVLHPVAGRPMLFYPIEVVKSLGIDKVVVIVGHKAEEVINTLQEVRSQESGVRSQNKSQIQFVKQEPQLGTGNAVLCAEDSLKDWKGNVLILSGDVPLITRESILGLLDLHAQKKASISFISAIVENPTGYGRVVRDKKRSVIRIVEDKDASPKEKANNEINTGIYYISVPFLFSSLKKIKKENAQGEYYLPDLIGMAVKQKKRVAALTHINAAEVMGINNRIELSEANEEMRERINNELMLSGVTLIAPETAYIHKGVKIGRDTTIYPNVFLEGNSSIGDGCLIEEGCKIINSTIGDNSSVKSHSVIESSQVGQNVSIGPFARLRPESVIEDTAKVGNFVEIKKSRLGRGTKANHLSYIGDAIIGKDVNIGAGTITCNYDGIKKHQTTIEDGAFIGSDTQLVAPVKVGKNAYIGSGSTITKNVPAGSLALSRPEQRIVEGWVERKRLKKKSAER